LGQAWFQIRANIGDSRLGIVQTLVNTGKKKVRISIGQSGVEVDSIESTALGFGDLTERELHETEAVLPSAEDGVTRRAL
jgi:hypothetical protein